MEQCTMRGVLTLITVGLLRAHLQSRGPGTERRLADLPGAGVLEYAMQPPRPVIMMPNCAETRTETLAGALSAPPHVRNVQHARVIDFRRR
jgi:hypothetical protein